MLTAIQKIKELVKQVLKDYPETRNDDKYLYLCLWEIQGFRLNDKQKFMFRKVATPESITRAKREIQSGGLYRGASYQYKLDECKKITKYYKK